jgi:hypothetical protein
VKLKRCLYHLALGLTLSFCWFVLAQPVGLCEGPGNTGPYWLGMFLALLFLQARAARYFQINMSEIPIPEERLRVWFRLASPYLLEIVPYLGVAVLLSLMGGADTLSQSYQGPGLELAILSLVCLFLFPICATMLGWKLYQSNLPSYLPILTAGSLCVVVIPVSFHFNDFLIPGSFPLVQVCVVAILALLFLLMCSRFPGPWLDSLSPPHPALGLACLLPGILPIMGALAEVRGEPSAYLAFLLIGCSWFVLAACPAYLLARLVPSRYQLGLRLTLTCGTFGIVVLYTMAWSASVAFCLESAPWIPHWNWCYLIGGLSAIAPLFVDSGPEKGPGPGPTGEGIMVPASKSLSCEL